MLTPIANVHRHRLPKAGEIVYLSRLARHNSNLTGRFIVEAYPLSDSADQRYSRGIHTVWLRKLADSSRVHVAGHWCEEEPGSVEYLRRANRVKTYYNAFKAYGL